MAKHIQLKNSNNENLYPNVIVEKVVNSNGTAIKYADGTMIVTQRVGISRSISSSWGNNFISPAINLPDFPVAFTTLYSCVYSLESKLYNAWIMSRSPNYKTRAAGCFLISPENITTFTGYINVFAVGRWK